MHMELSNQFVFISWVNFAVLIGFLLLGIFSRKLNNLFFFQFPLSKRRRNTGRFATMILAQHSVAMLEQCYKHSKHCCNNVSTLCCAKIVAANRLVLTLTLSGWMMESFKVARALTFKFQRNCATHRVKVKEKNRRFEGALFRLL